MRFIPEIQVVFKNMHNNSCIGKITLTKIKSFMFISVDIEKDFDIFLHRKRNLSAKWS